MTCERRVLRIPLVLLSSLLLFGGCQSGPQNMRERFSPLPPRLKTLEADARTTFFAAQLAFKRLDFDLTRTSVTGYRVEATRRVDPSQVDADTRQLQAYLGAEDVGRNKCEVSLRLIAAPEGRGFAGSGEVALHEHELYEKFFAVLQQVLAEQVESGASQ